MSYKGGNRDYDFDDIYLSDEGPRADIEELISRAEDDRDQDDDAPYPFIDDDEPRRPAASAPKHTPPAPVDTFAEKEDMRSEPSKLSQYINWILSGNILSKAEVRKQYPYIAFMALLTFIYITNIFNNQKLYRRQDRLTTQVKELRSKSLTLSSIRMSSTRQSAILKELRERGIPLRESLSPPTVVEK